MKKSIKSFALILALAVCAATLLSLPTLAADAVDWELSQDERILTGDKTYYEYLSDGSIFLDPICIYYFQDSVYLSNGGLYVDGESPVYSYAPDGEIVWVEGETEYFVYATEKGREYLDALSDRSGGNFILVTDELDYAVLDVTLPVKLDNSGWRADNMYEVSVSELMSCPRYDVRVYDESLTATYVYGIVFTLANGSYGYVSVDNTDNPVFDVFGDPKSSFGRISVHLLDKELSNELDSAIARATPMYEEYERVAYGYNGGNTFTLILFWLTLIIVGIGIPIPLLVISLLLPRSAKLGYPKHWYILTVISALWILLSLIFMTILIIV